MKGLEIGGERTPAYRDYDQLDIMDWNEHGNPTTIFADARELPLEDEIYDHVFAGNVLEHFSWRETKDIIIEWLRVLKSNGLLEIIVPDTLGIIADYTSGKNTWEHCCERLAGTQDYPGNAHLAFFTFEEFPNVVPSWVDLDLEQTHAGGGITAKVYK